MLLATHATFIVRNARFAHFYGILSAAKSITRTLMAICGRPGYSLCVCVRAQLCVCVCVKQQGDRLNRINAFNKIYSPTVDACVEYKHIFKLHPHNLLAPHITQRRAHNINSEWRTRATMPLTRKQFAGLSCSTRRLCYLRLKAQRQAK